MEPDKQKFRIQKANIVDDVKKDGVKEDDAKEDKLKEDDMKEDEVKEDDLMKDGVDEDDVKEEDVKEDRVKEVLKEEKSGEVAFPNSSWGSQLPPASPKASESLLTWRPWEKQKLLRWKKKRSPASEAKPASPASMAGEEGPSEKLRSACQ